MVAKPALESHFILPSDASDAILVGRVWSNAAGGPCPVLLRNSRVYDLSDLSATVAGLLELDGIAARLASADNLVDLGSLDDYLSGKSG